MADSTTQNFDGINAVKIDNLNLTSLVSKRSIDITGTFVQLEIFQSIFQPTMLGSITISDGSGLLQNLPILGEEGLIIEIETPNRQKFSKLMYVYGVENLDYDENGTHINFKLNFASTDIML